MVLFSVLCVLFSPLFFFLHTPKDEIDSLQKELEELKGKNLNLESQLKAVLHPGTPDATDTMQESPQLSDDEHKANPETWVSWTKKLQTAHDMYEKVKDDMEKLTEVVNVY